MKSVWRKSCGTGRRIVNNNLARICRLAYVDKISDILPSQTVGRLCLGKTARNSGKCFYLTPLGIAAKINYVPEMVSWSPGTKRSAAGVSAMITRDILIREMRAGRGSWPAILAVYLIILGAMLLSGMAIS